MKELNKMRIACSSQSFDQMILDGKMSLQQFFEFCSSIEFIQGVELEDKHIEQPNNAEYLHDIRELSRTYQLPIVNLAFDCNFGYTSQEKLQGELSRVEEWLEVSKALDIPRFRLFAGWPDANKVEQWPEMIKFLQKAAVFIKQANQTVVIENHNHGGFLSNSDDVVNMFRDLGDDHMKLLLDTGNYVDGLAGVLKTAKWSGHVHAKVKAIDETGRPFDINYPPMLKQLYEDGYDGWLSIEYEGDLDPKQVVDSFGSFLNNQIKLLTTGMES